MPLKVFEDNNSDCCTLKNKHHVTATTRLKPF